MMIFFSEYFASAGKWLSVTFSLEMRHLKGKITVKIKQCVKIILTNLCTIYSDIFNKALYIDDLKLVKKLRTASNGHQNLRKLHQSDI